MGNSHPGNLVMSSLAMLTTFKLGQQADVIVANPISYAAVHCADALGLPVHIIFTQPWTPTGVRPHAIYTCKLCRHCGFYRCCRCHFLLLVVVMVLIGRCAVYSRLGPGVQGENLECI